MGEFVYGTDGHVGRRLAGEKVVRCRDCVRGVPCGEGRIRCLKRREVKGAEWFCADGKERTC